MKTLELYSDDTGIMRLILWHGKSPADVAAQKYPGKKCELVVDNVRSILADAQYLSYRRLYADNGDMIWLVEIP